MPSFPDRLKELRKSKGIAQKELANLLGLKHERSYRFYEEGKADPPTSKMQILAEYFNVSTDYLLGLTDCPDRK